MSVLVISITLLCFLSDYFRPIQGKNILGPIQEVPALESHEGSLGNVQSNFARVYRLPDGELITKLRLNNTTAIETQYSNIDLIQIIQGESIIQLWRSNGELVDCEFTTDSNKLNTLRAEFDKVNPNIHFNRKNIRLQNIETITNLSDKYIPQKFLKLLNYDSLVDECTKHHERVRNAYRLKGKSKIRSKRDLLVYPGTKWCGRGSSSHSFEDLGDSAFADRCCRDHDRCKYSIGSFETKYYLTNLRPHFLSHCSCDERFRSCLKLANSGASNMIGKIYFNIVQMKCFMFEFSPHCEEYTWWGTCLRSKRRKRAVARSPMEY